MYNFSSYDTFKKCQRSFDLETPVSSDLISKIQFTMDQFVVDNNLDVDNFVITDRNEIKLIHSSAIHEYEPENLIWKTNTQVLAPLLVLCLPKKNKDINTLSQIGRLYSRIGLMSIDYGYKTAFCLCIKTQVLSVWNTTKKYARFDHESGLFVRPVFLSIGNPLDATRPYNWSAMYNKFNPSHVRTVFDNIKIHNY